MPYDKTTWVDEVPDDSPIKYSITDDVEGEIAGSAVIEVETAITPGTPLNATNMNKLETGVETAQAAAEAAQDTADDASEECTLSLLLYDYRDIAIFIPLNGAQPLTVNDKAYWRVPAKGPLGEFAGALISVAAMCVTPSSSGVITLTVKNGGVSMLSTNITIDEGETDTDTAAAPAAVGVNNEVETGDHIAVEVSGCGVGATYVGVELVVRFTEV
jgi:hypothetical protein